jgi:anti-anti-sigma factor
MTPDILSVTTQDGPAASCVLVVAGEIDRDSRDNLRRAAEQAISEGHHRLIADLAAVSFCDSSGLSLFIDLQRETEAHGGWFRLVGARPVLQEVLRITNLDRLLPIHASIAAATQP